MAMSFQKSSKWLYSRILLKAQGYNQGNIELWLPKSEFLQYKVIPKTIVTCETQRRRTTTQKSKQKQRQRNQRQQLKSQASTFGRSKTNENYE